MKTYRVSNPGDSTKEIAEAAQVLRDGGVVAFPTETVYGLGCNADDPRAVERLRALKGQRADKPFTVHLHSAEEIANYVDSIPEKANRLIRRFVPGPLTLVLQAKGGGMIGLRVPDHPVARELIRLSGVRVIGTSANRSDATAPVCAEEVRHAFPGGEIDVLIDSGQTTYGAASSVVRVTDEGWEVLREGAISKERIVRTVSRTILFVCTGNSCRSPMAEALTRRLLAEKLEVKPGELLRAGYCVLSAGTAAPSGRPASENARAVMAEMGIDISAHRTRPLTRELIEDAERIYAMSAGHYGAILRIVPGAGQKTRILGEHDIEDPYGQSKESYRECAAEIREALLRELDRL